MLSTNVMPLCKRNVRASCATVFSTIRIFGFRDAILDTQFFKYSCSCQILIQTNSLLQKFIFYTIVNADKVIPKQSFFKAKISERKGIYLVLEQDVHRKRHFSKQILW